MSNLKKNTPETLAALFKALAHPVRLQIVQGLLRKHECNVSTIVEKLGKPQPTVSQHITILKSQGVIEGFRKGNQICYRVASPLVKKIFEAIF
ncbi:MAG: metalloregulator ArsR/SmtB family transcription factor [Chloroflexi bacterium]|nr:metalloregulator ArsR/SmtB family transcription factor [Chloroflexota bacterium]